MRPVAHWLLVSWEDVQDPEGDPVVARAVLCREHLTSVLQQVERLPGTDCGSSAQSVAH